jgi:phosphatidylethanolamine/phosphatidyl-N-methylethanolamine N-methyltransferase
MILQLRQKLAERFDGEVRFFKGWLDGPKSVGTPFPTSAHTGRAMASVIDRASGLPVLEIGPGTGTITRAILARGVPPQDLYAVEYSADFVEGLRMELPEVRVFHGDVFQLDEALGKNCDLTFDCVISAIPLLNFPVRQRVSYIEDMLKRIPPGRPVIQVTYGPMPPIPAGHGRFLAVRSDFVIRNVPPAHLWTYWSLPG